jgi:cytochrome c biogenesis factor
MLSKVYLYYSYIYYRIYKFFIRLSKSDDPEFKSIVIFSLLLFFHILGIYGLLTSIRALTLLQVPKIFLLIFFLLIIFLNYMLFIFRGKSDQLRKEYSFENIKGLNKVLGNWLLWLYIVLPFVEMLIAGIITRRNM